MTLSSTSFEDGGILPLKYATAGATAANPMSVAPQLSWGGEPATAIPPWSVFWRIEG